jgi:hypothetical protein
MLSLIYTDRMENTVSNNASTIACISIAAELCLLAAA